jgi:DNA polymerase-3 subunit epsilon
MATTRERATASAARLMRMQPRYLDTETTGLGPADQIVEIGIIGHDGSVVFESLVRPTVPIPLDASRVHGISTGMVMSAPGWGEIWPLVVEHLEGWPVAIYNADFDLRLVRQSNRRAGIVSSLDPARVTCLMQLYAEFHGEWDGQRRSYRWQSLEAASRQCGLRLPNAHRAVQDAQLARRLLEHMASASPSVQTQEV